MNRFLLYGILGWCAEILWTGTGSLIAGDARLTAQTYLWMHPIYGLAVLLEPVHDLIRTRPWPVRGILWMLLFFAVEYASGWAIRAVTGLSPWNYDGQTFSVDGLIRLDYAAVWFAAGLIFEWVHDRLDRTGKVR